MGELWQWARSHRGALAGIAVIAVVGATVGVTSLLRELRPTSDPPDVPGVAADVVAEHLDRYAGRTLQVRGEVSIGGEEALRLGDSGLLVIPRRRDMVREYAIGDDVLVAGRVRRFDVRGLDPLTDADLDEATVVERALPGDPVVLADSVVEVHGGG